MAPTIAIAQRVKAARKQKALSQNALARLWGRQRRGSDVSQIETGARTPTRETLEALATALQVPVTQLDPLGEAWNPEAPRSRGALVVPEHVPVPHAKLIDISVTKELESRRASSDNPLQIDDNTRGADEMRDRGQDDPWRGAIIAAYDSLGTFPSGVRERMQRRFADGVNHLLGELMAPQKVGKKAKNR